MSLETALEAACAADAVLINCSTPEAVTTALDVLRGIDKPFGAYANGFTEIRSSFVRTGATVRELSARTDLSPEAYAAFAEGWAAKGATIIGGCCEVGPAHIAELARRLT
jgi:homocysteine S-methyltransferase